jgi:SAM-dependent methyltransferase
MIFEYLKLNIDVDDDEFNVIYPERIRTLARRHWTSVAVAKQAAEFLVDKPGTRVLDIGSGPGKFCMVGASYTKGYFTGVEQRQDLVELSKRISRSHRISNVNFIHSNITSVKLKDYDAFYFYNSFHENIDSSAKIDETINASIELYDLYHQYLYEQLCLAPKGSRLATYRSTLKEVPSNYQLQYSLYDGALKFWKKIS